MTRSFSEASGPGAEFCWTASASSQPPAAATMPAAPASFTNSRRSSFASTSGTRGFCRQRNGEVSRRVLLRHSIGIFRADAAGAHIAHERGEPVGVQLVPDLAELRLHDCVAG